ncbi:MAG: hypothetical protein PHI99_02425 [Syntrophales bacterium]|nr:hypothetical protein [Syntrophales bacterium]
MGFLETLSGRKKVLSFEIIFDEYGKVGVMVSKSVPMLATSDYIRLWACYKAKMVYNLGYPNNESANIAIGALKRIVENDIREDTDCFQRSNFKDVIQYAYSESNGNIRFTGEFYAKGSFERNIKTWLPPKGTEQQAVYSTLALMQYAVSMTRDDKECLEVFTKTARNMVKLYESGAGVGMAAIVQVPTLAYMQAIGLAE